MHILEVGTNRLLNQHRFVKMTNHHLQLLAVPMVRTRNHNRIHCWVRNQRLDGAHQLGPRICQSKRDRRHLLIRLEDGHNPRPRTGQQRQIAQVLLTHHAAPKKPIPQRGPCCFHVLQ